MTRFPAFAARRGGVKAATWWGRAWLRAVEESAYDEGDLRDGWRLARSGGVGGIGVEPGSVVAAVSAAGEVWSVEARVPVLPDADREALVEVVGAAAGRIAALLSGELPEELAEHAEEVGVALVPDGFETSCTCESWVQPCAHALAVLAQAAWLADADPLVLFALLGLPKSSLLESLAGGVAGSGDEEAEADLDVAADAVIRAERMLDELGGPDQPA